MEGKKIVVVDDDYETREFMADVLTFGGYTVITWPALQGALALIRDEQPVLAILDLQMPGDMQAGALLADQLHDDPTTAAIPIILYSAGAWALQTHVQAIRACGGDVLAKPFPVDVLYAMIERLMVVE